MSLTGFDLSQEAPVGELSEKQYRLVRDLAYRVAGINLGEGKQSLVRARLCRRLRALNLRFFDEYFERLANDQSGEELTQLLDALTTNKTSFFRESQHFDFLRARVLPEICERRGPARLWSAGCSSGEEPYTIAMCVCEEVPEVRRREVRILATDISTRMLARARAGVYDEGAVASVPAALLSKYFSRESKGEERTYRVCASVRELVRFARLNLMDSWPMSGPFDAIFCRNVMIYFDKATQQELIRRFHRLLRPGGYLFVGHSESLTGTASGFRYVQPAVYVK